MPTVVSTLISLPVERNRFAALRPISLPAVCAAVACSLMAGCSGGSPGGRAAAPRSTEPLVAVTTSADPGRPILKPVPEVITRPRPFRMPAAVGLDPQPDQPATMRVPAARVAPAAFAATASASATASADTPTPPASEAGAEIRDMLASYLQAFNRHDPAALASHWTAAGESVDLDTGEVTAGRDAVKGVFAALFEADEAARIDIDVGSIRPIREDVAVVDGITRLSFTDGTAAGSRFSAVVVRQDGAWQLESVRESSQPVASERPLDELAWLLGLWEDLGEGVTASTQCSWSAGRGFLVRSHVVRADAVPQDRPAAGDARIPALLPPGDAQPREINEIIGWDPERGSIRSWIFTSAGRFAEGTWTRAGERWTVRVEGRGRDEGLVGEVTLEPVGADGLVVRSVSDALAPLLPPACEFSRTARVD